VFKQVKEPSASVSIAGLSGRHHQPARR